MSLEEEYWLMTNLSNSKIIHKSECPFCGSKDVLPHEEDKSEAYKQTFTLILLSAFSLFGAYLLFLLSAYLFFPGVVLISIYFFTRIVGERERKRTIIYKHKDFICLKCGDNFEDVEKISC